MLSCYPAGSLKGNWQEFWRQVHRDHAHAGLIWNERTRTELRDALQVIPGSLDLQNDDFTEDAVIHACLITCMSGGQLWHSTEDLQVTWFMSRMQDSDLPVQLPGYYRYAGLQFHPACAQTVSTI